MKRIRLLSVALTILLLSIPAYVSAQTKKLTVLYSNDLHAHLEPHRVPWISETRLVGGFANFATLVKREKAKNPNTLCSTPAISLPARTSVR